MDLTADSFRALARSSPWRWQALHFRRHDDEPLEAWVNRPGELRVVDARGRSTVERETLDGAGGVLTVYTTNGEQPPPKPKIIRPWPHQVEPVLRTDGLVAERPEGHEWRDEGVVVIEYGDPMYINYHWVAMLDPLELSAGTMITDLRVAEHRGRSVWRARIEPVEGYQPTCGCCALLWSEISDRDEYDDDWPLDPNRVYPEAYDVALDVATSIVVLLEPMGESTGNSRLDVEILAAKPWPIRAG